MFNWLTDKLKSNKSLLLYSFIFVCIFVLTAHAFGFLNLDLSHDYLNEFHTLDSQGWKISIGRFMSPLINLIFGQAIISPWLSGVIMILVLSLSVYLIIKMFHLEKRWQIILLAGFLSTSLSISAIIASFMQDLAVDMIALLLAVFSAYQWNKLKDHFNLKTFLLSLFSLFISLGCYQGYLSITITLIIIKCLENFLIDKKPKDTIKHGLIGLVIIAGGAILYFATANIVSNITGYQLASNTTNSLSNVWGSNKSLPGRVLSTYSYTLWGLFAPTLASVPVKANLLAFSDTTYQVYLISIINILIFLFCAIIVIRIFINKKINNVSKIFCLILLLITPFAMNITHFLSGDSHTLMHYSFVFFYLIFIILSRYLENSSKSTFLKNCNIFLLFCSGVIILINISLSNTLYVKKDLEKQATLSTITRVLSAVESQDGYVYGETKVCLIGDIESQNKIKDIPNVAMLFGADYNASVTYQDTYNSYFNNVLLYKAVPCTRAEINSIKETEWFQNMKTFPNKDSLKATDGEIIVKMSN